jgi:hypothetical protein
MNKEKSLRIRNPFRFDDENTLQLSPTNAIIKSRYIKFKEAFRKNLIWAISISGFFILIISVDAIKSKNSSEDYLIPVIIVILLLLPLGIIYGVNKNLSQLHREGNF